MAENRTYRLPAWVVPPAHAVSDVACLALRGVVEDRSRQECAGMVSAIGWVRHLIAVGPVTGRDELVVTEEVARAESFAAATARPDWPPPPLDQVCKALDVAYWPTLEVDPGFAWGVCATLRWLTGTDTEQAPLPIPVRTATGALAGETEIYAGLLARNPERRAMWERAALRREARETAARSQYLAALVADTATRARA
jgi:hypothetical protein